MLYALVIIVAAGVIIVANYLISAYLQRRKAGEVARILQERLQQLTAQEREQILERVKGSFAIISQEALGRSTDELLKLARQTLDARTKEGEKDLEGKKKLIDQSLAAMGGELEKVRAMLKEFEKGRSEQYGSLETQLKTATEITSRLEETTGRLSTALSSSRQRGQWGERMAEDVLRLAGFIEGIQYRKQKQMEGVGQRPDFTFFLPNDLVVNMDVKFPLDNYLRYLNADKDAEKEKLKSQFLRDVQNRIKEVTSREYINPDEHTVDYVLVFIPNEQVYAFIQETSPALIDRAMAAKVVLCSPLTLYAVLAVIRQAVENFNLEQTTARILSLLGAFRKQWSAFVVSMEKMGRKIEEAGKEYDRLVSTRRKMLERPLKKIEELRQQKEIEPAELPEEIEGAGESERPLIEEAE